MNVGQVAAVIQVELVGAIFGVQVLWLLGGKRGGGQVRMQEGRELVEAGVRAHGTEDHGRAQRRKVSSGDQGLESLVRRLPLYFS